MEQLSKVVNGVIMKAAERKSLMEWMAQSVDEELPGRGRELVLRGWERYEQDCHERRMAEQRRELLVRFPLLAVDE